MELALGLGLGRAWIRKRFIVHAEEMLTAFVELQRALHAFAVSLIF
jgi:hypothetical protein